MDALFLYKQKGGHSMALRLIDLEGNHYAAEASTSITEELNSDSTLSITFQSTRTNEQFISELAELWKISGIKGTADDTEYVVKFLSRKGIGDKMYVSVKAIPKMFDDLAKDRVYERYDQSFTAHNYFNLVFTDTPYTFTFLDSFEAQRFEGLGEGDPKIEMFKNGINRYGIEFEIVGTEVRMSKRVERDMPYQLRWRLNASNIQEEVDATGFATYAKGYGDYGDGDGGEDWQDAKLIREYTSPLAKVPGIGIRHAEPIKNGNMTVQSAMDENLKKLVDDSIKISVTADFHKLKNYPYANPQNGDLIHLIDERINFKRRVRIIEVITQRDVKGNITKQEIRFGDLSIQKRHQSKINATLSTVDNIMAGKQKIPFNALDAAVLAATKALQNAQTELVFPDSGGIHAVDKTNPNKMVVFNSAGLGITDNGGQTFKTAITGDGIVADVITAGTLRGIDIIGTNIISFSDNNDVITLSNGTIEAFEAGTKTFVVNRLGFTQFSPVTGKEVATLRSSVIVNTDYNGADLRGQGDYLSFGREVGSNSEARPQLRFSWFGAYDQTFLYGGAGIRDSGRLELRSTHTGGTAGNFIPKMIISNYSDSGTAFSSASLYFGRDNRRPGAADFVSGFSLWQYTGEGNGNSTLFLEADTNSDGVKQLRSWADEIYIDGGVFRGNGSRLELGSDGNGQFFRAVGVYYRTYTATTQMVRVTENGVLGRSTSSRRYKLLEEEIDLEYAKRILLLNPKSWFDKRAAEEYAHTLQSGEDTEIQRIERIGGIIAEDTHDAGLGMYVNYNDEGQPDGVSDNLMTLIIPVVGDHEKRIAELERKIEGVA